MRMEGGRKKMMMMTPDETCMLARLVQMNANEGKTIKAETNLHRGLFNELKLNVIVLMDRTCKTVSFSFGCIYRWFFLFYLN